MSFIFTIWDTDVDLTRECKEYISTNFEIAAMKSCLYLLNAQGFSANVYNTMCQLLTLCPAFTFTFAWKVHGDISIYFGIYSENLTS